MVQVPAGSILVVSDLDAPVRARSAAIMAVVDDLKIAEDASARRISAMAIVDMPDTASRALRMVAMAITNDEPVEPNDIVAHGFSMDGSDFYVLSLANVATLVYCLQSKQWSEWASFGASAWNARAHASWNGKVVAGTFDGPEIVALTPGRRIDLDGSAIPMRFSVYVVPPEPNRRLVVDRISFTASAGDVTTLPASLGLRFSDDDGVTWFTPDEVVLTGAAQQRVQFTSLGSFEGPGRLFEVFNDGALLRVTGAEIIAR